MLSLCIHNQAFALSENIYELFIYIYIASLDLNMSITLLGLIIDWKLYYKTLIYLLL